MRKFFLSVLLLFLGIPVLQASPVTIEEVKSLTKKVPNIDKVARGYNIMRANPDHLPETKEGKLTLDPGFMYPIFNISDDDDNPKGVDIDRLDTCVLNFATTIVHGAASYSNSLRVKVSADFSGWGASFKASTDYQTIEKGTSDEENVYTKSTAYCEVYKVAIKKYTPPPLSDEFLIAVSLLNAPYDSKNPGDYIDLIEYFGTHVFRSAILGGKFGQQSKISKTSWTSLTKTSLKIEASASFSAFFASFSGAASAMTEEQRRMAKSFSSYTSTQQIYAVGGPIPADGKGWDTSCIKEPQVIKYELTLISQLLTPQFFPDDQMIKTKQKNLELALKDYCNQLVKAGTVKDCNPPVDPDIFHDDVFGGMYQVDDCGTNNLPNALTGGLYCPRGYTSIQASRLQCPEGGWCGANQFYCVDRSKIGTNKGSFGGIFQKSDDSKCLSGNPECGGLCLCCNTQAVPFQRVYHPEVRVGSTVMICLNGWKPGISQIGGSYQRIDTGKPWGNINNPYTGGPSCPDGYKSIQIGRIKVPEGGQHRDGANSFICVLQ